MPILTRPRHEQSGDASPARSLDSPGARDAGVAQWQHRLTPIWKRIGGGCHLNRRIDEIIKGAGFQIPALAASYIPGPRPMTYTYQGIAHSA